MSSTAPTIEIRPANGQGDFSNAVALLHDYAHWIATATGLDPFVEQPTFSAELLDLPAAYDGERGMLLMAFEQDVPLATVAVIVQGDRAELKRMYVRPAARGRSLAPRLLEAACDAARSAGCDVIWLESLTGTMDRAIELYRRFGFSEVEEASTIGVAGMVVLELEL